MRQKELRSLRFYRLLYSIVAESFRRFSILAKIVLIIQDSLTKEFCVGAYLCKAENCCSLERRSAGVVNRSLGDRLRCLVGDHIANWYQVLPMAEFAYNSSVSRTTGRSPCSLSRFWPLSEGRRDSPNTFLQMEEQHTYIEKADHISYLWGFFISLILMRQRRHRGETHAHPHPNSNFIGTFIPLWIWIIW